MLEHRLAMRILCLAIWILSSKCRSSTNASIQYTPHFSESNSVISTPHPVGLGYKILLGDSSQRQRGKEQSSGRLPLARSGDCDQNEFTLIPGGRLV